MLFRLRTIDYWSDPAITEPLSKLRLGGRGGSLNGGDGSTLHLHPLFHAV
jgi:hypothetical protein